MRLKNIFRIFLLMLMLTFGVVAIVYSFIAYSAFSMDVNGVIIRDGLGRQLSDAPLWAKFLLVNDPLWPGTFWTIFDRLFLFGLVGSGYLIFKISEKIKPVE